MMFECRGTPYARDNAAAPERRETMSDSIRD